MKKWWQDYVFWLLLGSLVLVGTLCSFWLSNAYRQAKLDLIRETSFVFAQSVRSLEDSLIHQNFIQRLQADSSSKPFGLPPNDEAIVRVHGRIFRTLEGEDSQRIPKHYQLRRRLAESGQKGFAGSLGLFYKVKAKQSTPAEIIDQKVFSALSSRVTSAFASEDFPFEVALCSARFEPDSFYVDEKLSSQQLVTRSYLDFSNHTRYFVELINAGSYLAGLIKYQVVFSFLLMAVMLLAFIASYRLVSKQRRLAIIKNDLISNITHELKTPLATVKVALEAIQNFSVDSDPKKSKEYLQIAQVELDRLSLLVDNVLKTSVREGREITLKMERLNLNDLVLNILHTMKLQFEKLAAQVTFDAPHGPLYIRGDRMHLTSVIYNLLDNALKYSRENPRISIVLKSKNKLTQLSVTDHGTGIAQVHQKQIFEKFYRVQNHNIHNTKGHGLGLNYVKQVVQKHQGTIKVQSEVAKGSTFTISMPAYRND